MTIQSPTDFSPEAIKAWIIKVSEELDITPTQLSKRAQIAPSTVNKFLADAENQARNLNGRTISKLVVAAIELDSARKHTYRPLPPIPEEIIEAHSSVLVEIPVIDAGNFQEDVDLYIFFRITIPIPTPYSDNQNLFAVQIDEGRANGVFPVGSILVVDGPRRMARTTPIAGERVIIGERIAGASELKLSVREMLESPSGDRWLVGLPVGESPLPDIYMGRGNFEAAPPNVTVLGRVIVSIRPEPSVYGGIISHAAP